jgi:hypothetical protein
MFEIALQHSIQFVERPLIRVTVGKRIGGDERTAAFSFREWKAGGWQ